MKHVDASSPYCVGCRRPASRCLCPIELRAVDILTVPIVAVAIAVVIVLWAVAAGIYYMVGRLFRFQHGDARSSLLDETTGLPMARSGTMPISQRNGVRWRPGKEDGVEHCQAPI